MTFPMLPSNVGSQRGKRGELLVVVVGVVIGGGGAGLGCVCVLVMRRRTGNK